jgi:hypothetical protein
VPQIAGPELTAAVPRRATYRRRVHDQNLIRAARGECKQRRPDLPDIPLACVRP